MDLLDFLSTPGEEITRETKIMKQTGVFGIIIASEAPVVVCDCISFMRGRGLTSVGLFRVNGSMEVIEEIKLEYTKYYNEKLSPLTVDVDVLGSFEGRIDINDVASLLKNYFMKLEEPIIPYKIYNNICHTYETHRGDSDDDDLLRGFDAVLVGMISPNRECLCYVLSFLREVAAYQDANKMSVENLARIWAMSLMRGKSPMEDMQRLGIATGALKALLTLPIRMYLPSEETIKRNTKHKRGPPPPPPYKAMESKPPGITLTSPHTAAPPREPKPVLAPPAPPRTQRLPKPEF